mmetsp:Transcript_18731/g.33426  ORF Transcript_18731/g.33426 Transcript_18731/m.33426 type:complete len:125 (-) Transcript_18731:339-713(-)
MLGRPCYWLQTVYWQAPQGSLPPSSEPVPRRVGPRLRGPALGTAQGVHPGEGAWRRQTKPLGPTPKVAEPKGYSRSRMAQREGVRFPRGSVVAREQEREPGQELPEAQEGPLGALLPERPPRDP